MQQLYKDTKGRVIDQRAKDSKSVEIDGTSLFAGHKFLLKTKLYGDKRCVYCGRWFHWKETDYLTWLRTKNIDSMHRDKGVEPLHCGSSHCEEFHRRYLRHQEKLKKERRGEAEVFFLNLYKKLKKQGVVR